MEVLKASLEAFCDRSQAPRTFKERTVPMLVQQYQQLVSELRRSTGGLPDPLVERIVVNPCCASVCVSRALISTTMAS
jgi:hypothetical protein